MKKFITCLLALMMILALPFGIVAEELLPEEVVAEIEELIAEEEISEILLEEVLIEAPEISVEDLVEEIPLEVLEEGFEATKAKAVAAKAITLNYLFNDGTNGSKQKVELENLGEKTVANIELVLAGQEPLALAKEENDWYLSYTGDPLAKSVTWTVSLNVTPDEGDPITVPLKVTAKSLGCAVSFYSFQKLVTEYKYVRSPDTDMSSTRIYPKAASEDFDQSIIDKDGFRLMEGKKEIGKLVDGEAVEADYLIVTYHADENYFFLNFYNDPEFNEDHKTRTYTLEIPTVDGKVYKLPIVITWPAPKVTLSDDFYGLECYGKTGARYIGSIYLKGTNFPDNYYTSIIDEENVTIMDGKREITDWRTTEETWEDFTEIAMMWGSTREIYVYLNSDNITENHTYTITLPIKAEFGGKKLTYKVNATYSVPSVSIKVSGSVNTTSLDCAYITPKYVSSTASDWELSGPVEFSAEGFECDYIEKTGCYAIGYDYDTYTTAPAKGTYTGTIKFEDAHGTTCELPFKFKVTSTKPKVSFKLAGTMNPLINDSACLLDESAIKFNFEAKNAQWNIVDAKGNNYDEFFDWKGTESGVAIAIADDFSYDGKTVYYLQLTGETVDDQLFTAKAKLPIKLTAPKRLPSAPPPSN